MAGIPGNAIAKWAIPCFPAGTPIRTPDGDRPIESLRPGDLVLSRDEHSDGSGEVVAKRVEEVFVREGRQVEVRVGGRQIITTPEHPFFVRGDGWIPAGQLQPGDQLSTLDGEWLPVESIRDLDTHGTVYNLRVAEYHTYFVGREAWGFAVWVHNGYDVDEAIELGQMSVKRLRPDIQVHHIATRDGEWGQQFHRLFAPAGLDLDDAFNTVRLKGHVGPHGWYNKYVFKRLSRVVAGKAGEAYRAALVDELLELRWELKKTDLSHLVQAAASPFERSL